MFVAEDHSHRFKRPIRCYERKRDVSNMLTEETLHPRMTSGRFFSRTQNTRFPVHSTGASSGHDRICLGQFLTRSAFDTHREKLYSRRPQNTGLQVGPRRLPNRKWDRIDRSVVRTS
jgi:hypothetical protein